MKRSVFFLFIIFLFTQSHAQEVSPIQPEKGFRISGIYFQWGWNEVWYTHSNIHFRLSNGDNFTVHDAKAHQRKGFYNIYKDPIEPTLPQYNARLGIYLNRAHTRALEISFDHTKYVVTDGQTVHVTGIIDGEQVDDNRIMDPNTFLHFEHTDGANWLSLNYVSQHRLVSSKKKGHDWLTLIWKAGGGINIPRTDFTYFGNRLNNKFHVAGFNLGGEAGARFYPAKVFFIELTGKSGFIDYTNALADTREMTGNRASQVFGYFEVIGTLGINLGF